MVGGALATWVTDACRLVRTVDFVDAMPDSRP